MGAEMIGKQIAVLRKERGVKQEELAKFVGVSIQAVSKWENGGVPDTELLPKIADFFSVSIDTLFGNSIINYNDLQSAIIQKIKDAPSDAKFNEAFSLCWAIERALYPTPITRDGLHPSIEDFENALTHWREHYSCIIADQGFTGMGISNRLQYFLLVPETQDIELSVGSPKYTELFSDLANQDFFNACIAMYKRTSTRAFTLKLLMTTCNFTAEKATEVLQLFRKYSLAFKTEVEDDDNLTTIYHFKPRQSFISLLIFAREMIRQPCLHVFSHHSRTKPYLK